MLKNDMKRRIFGKKSGFVPQGTFTESLAIVEPGDSKVSYPSANYATQVFRNEQLPSGEYCFQITAVNVFTGANTSTRCRVYRGVGTGGELVGDKTRGGFGGGANYGFWFSTPFSCEPLEIFTIYMSNVGTSFFGLSAGSYLYNAVLNGSNQSRPLDFWVKGDAYIL